MLNNATVRSKVTNEKGVVSIITVVLLSMVLALITMAFVRSATGNQRQALDTQLSTQAFYAAETGINDALSILNNNLANPATDMNTENCTTFLNVIRDKIGITDPDKLNSDSNIEYTCVLVNSSVSELSVTRGDSVIFQIVADDTTDKIIDQLSISWGNSNQTVPMGNGTDLYDQTAWKTAGTNGMALIRVTFYYPSSWDRINLNSDQKTFFLRPVRSGGVSTLVTNDNSTTTGVACVGNNGPCSLKFTGIASLTGNATSFYIRIAAIYDTFDSSNVTIAAYNSSGVQKNLIGAQYSIDVTGRANDIYRRIEVRHGVMADWDFPDSVVNSGGGGNGSGDLCKQFEIWSGGYSDPLNCLAP
jgi:Tfp pilus assembly protein PilX